MTRRTGAVAALVALYFVLRAWNLRAFCLDSDEVFSVTMARLGLGELLARVAGDLVHPPLSYLLLKVWIAIGGAGLLWVRLLPFTLSALALVPLFALFRRLELSFGARVLALALIAVNEYQVYHARYVRMYALFFLLGLTSLWLFLAWMEDGGWRRLMVLSAANVLLVYTHYYGWTLVVAEAVALIIWERRRLRAFAVAVAAVALAFAPWAVVVCRSRAAQRGLAPNLGWFTRPGLGDLLWFYAGLDGPLAPIPIASAVAVIAVVLLAVGFPRRDRRMGVLALAALLPPLTGFAVSYTMPQSVWGNRHLIIAAVPYIVLLAVALTRLRPVWLRGAGVALLSAWLAWGAYRTAFLPEPLVDMRVIARHLASRSAGQSEVTVYSLDPFLPAWMGYHLEPYASVKWNLRTIGSVREAGGDRFWLIYNEKFLRDARQPKRLLRERGYEAGRGVRVADEWNRLVLVPVRRK